MKTQVVILMSLMALTTCHAASPPATTLVINQRVIDGQLLCVNGVHYVAVSDLARSLNGTVRRDGDRLALSIEPSAFPPMIRVSNKPSAIIVEGPRSALSSVSSQGQFAQATGKGTIRGTVIYYFNRNYGSKPDTGTGIWLVGPKVEIPEDRMFLGTTQEIILVNPKNDSQKVTIPVVRHTMADGNGNFELLDIPAGSYTIIMESEHTNGPRGEALRITQRDVLHRIEYRDIEVRPNQTTDASLDFGMTNF